MEEGFGELRADVRHIQSDASDIKADVRATNVRLEDLRKEMTSNINGVRSELGDKLDNLADKMVKGQKEAATSIENVRVELTGAIDDVKDRVENGRSETADKFERMQMRMDSAQKELAGKIDDVKDSLGQTRVWALLLYISLAGALLLVIAHGFKWL